MTQPVQRKSKPLTQKQARRKRVAKGITLAVLGFATFRLVAGNQNPQMHINWPAPPPDNVFATYVSASHATTETKGFDEAYEALIGRRNVLKKPLPVPPAQVVAANRADLARLRQEGFTHAFQIPPASNLDDPEYLKDFRSMARMLVLEGDVRAKQGDLRGGADSNLDAIRLGNDIPRNGDLSHYGTGFACQRIGERGLWRQLKSYSAADALYATRRLEELTRRQTSLTDALEGEKRYGQAGLSRLFHSNLPPSNDEEEGETAKESAILQWLDKYRNPFYAVWSKQTVLNNYCVYLDAEIQRSRAPYNPNAPKIPEPSDFISLLFVPVADRQHFKQVSGNAQRGLLIAALALQTYQKEHGGAAPEALAELTPRYLSAIPSDPFAASPNTPLRYRRQTVGNGFVLYSIGPNCIDDGGKPTDNSNCRPDDPPWMRTSTNVYDTSEGDIIAGLNF